MEINLKNSKRKKIQIFLSFPTVNFCVLLFVLSFFCSKTVQSANSKEEMTNGAKNWVSDELKIPIDSINITPPDKRVRIPKCEDEIKYDFPFESRETVRAKCKSPPWQFFLRVSSEDNKTLQILRPKIKTKKREVTNEYVNVLVAKSNLMRGDKLDKNSVKFEKKLKKRLPIDVFTNLEGLENQEMSRNVKAGGLIRSVDIKAAKLIKKGDKVLFSIVARGMLVKAMVEALEDGHMGEQIKLINKDSGKIVTGIVTGKNKVSGL